MKTKNIPEAWKKQWSKFMVTFFDYLPTKYEANKREWAVRKMIWDFKDGKRSVKVAELVAKRMREQFGAEVENVTLVCIPASSAAKTETRYKVFAEEVARLTGCENGNMGITIEDWTGCASAYSFVLSSPLHVDSTNESFRKLYCSLKDASTS